MVRSEPGPAYGEGSRGFGHPLPAVPTAVYWMVVKASDLKKQDLGLLRLCLHSLRSPDGIFCDLTYFSVACVLGLISSAGGHRSCLESMAAMATGGFSEAAGEAQVCFSGSSGGASTCPPIVTVARSLAAPWDLRVSTT